MRTCYVDRPPGIARIQAINSNPALLATTSLRVTFLSDPDVIRELLPPPLGAAEPRVTISVYEFAESNCVGPFNGASVSLACPYDGNDGFYSLTMPRTTDAAAVVGRERYGEPTKLARSHVKQRGRFVHGTVTSHGLTYIELAGVFDEPLSASGRETLSQHYSFKFLPEAFGEGLAFDPQPVPVTRRALTRQRMRGSGAVVLRESRHDPVIDIPVPEVEGATFSRGETRTSGEVVATVPAEAFLPWAFGKHDDLTAWADQFVLSTASLDA